MNNLRFWPNVLSIRFFRPELLAMDQNRSDIIFRTSQTPTQKVTKKKAPIPDSSSSSSSDDDFTQKAILAPNTQEEKAKESSSSEGIIEETQKPDTRKKRFYEKSISSKSSKQNESRYFHAFILAKIFKVLTMSWILKILFLLIFLFEKNYPG